MKNISQVSNENLFFQVTKYNFVKFSKFWEWETILWFSWNRTSLFLWNANPKIRPFRWVLYLGVKCTISEDTGLEKSLPSFVLEIRSNFVTLIKKKSCSFNWKGQSSDYSSCLYKLLFQEPRFIWGETWKTDPNRENKIAFMWTAVKTDSLKELQSK